MAHNLDKTSPLLKLSNNMLYSFYACDSRTGDFIAALAHTMNLTESGNVGRKVLVYVSESKIGFPGIKLPENDYDPIICSLLPANNPDMFNIQVQRIAQAVVADVIRKNGALIHGGLCSFKGCGAVMAGVGSIGKTTASNRLPDPWISYSDDATLIIPNDTGGHNAHPWPTWSRFYWGGPGGTWDVEKSLPLSAIFFLKQSETDYVELINKYQVKSMLIDTIEHVTRSNQRQEKEKQNFLKKCLKSANNIAAAIPAYRLGLTLEGEFWKEMEKVMPRSEKAEPFEKPKYIEKHLPVKDDQKEVYNIYRGPSMLPTFFEPELLTILPYNGKEEPKKGDVICYRVDCKDENIVHRVIAVCESGIQTKGDNNAWNDDYTVDKTAIIGRVISARKGNGTRTIYGGLTGILQMHLRKCYIKADQLIAKLLQNSYHYLVSSGIFIKLKPKHMIFKVAVFERYSQKYPKLVLNGRTVGTYDYLEMNWRINRLYRLFVDVKYLPILDMPNPNKTAK